MKVSCLENPFLQRLTAAAAGRPFDLAAAVEAMLAFYVEDRADGCDSAADGDMLVYQWSSGALTFSASITRRLLVTEGPDKGPWLFAVLLGYAASVKLAEVRSGRRQCKSPEQVTEFRRKILDSAAYRVVSPLPLLSSGVRFGRDNRRRTRPGT